jgi:hypothetical protein
MDEVTRRLYGELDFVFSNSAALVGECFLFKSFLWAILFFLSFCAVV